MYNFQLPKKEISKIRFVLSQPDGVIIFPTDTVWGIGCVINSKSAVKRIYSLKQRAENKPLILLGSNFDQLVPYVKPLSQLQIEIINKFLPGAVTFVLPKSELVPDYITSGMDTVGIRVPDHPPLINLLEEGVENHVLATTSANISGTDAPAFKDNLEIKADYILDDYGYNPSGAESTVVSLDKTGKIQVLRQGKIKI